jgi:hypothetical protein
VVVQFGVRAGPVKRRGPSDQKQDLNSREHEEHASDGEDKFNPLLICPATKLCKNIHIDTRSTTRYSFEDAAKTGSISDPGWFRVNPCEIKLL